MEDVDLDTLFNLQRQELEVGQITTIPLFGPGLHIGGKACSAILCSEGPDGGEISLPSLVRGWASLHFGDPGYPSPGLSLDVRMENGRYVLLDDGSSFGGSHVDSMKLDSL